jgi:alpha-beta hydrolase superfamily lysophospholipase
MMPGPAKTLVATQTEDGLVLEGVLIQPAENRDKPVLVWIHGFGANFYFGPYLRLGEALAAHGRASLIGNTRGHDFGTLLEPQNASPYLGGAAWERLQDSQYDLAAWIDFASDRDRAGVVLAGHSIGAVKVTAYQAQQQDARVKGMVLASPPLRPTWDARAHPAALAMAQQMAAEGRAESLFAGPWGLVSAQTYLSFDQFGFDQFGRATGAPNLALIRCPLLVVIGTNEAHVAAPEDLEIIRRNAKGAARLETQVIEGADHFYAQHESEVADILAEWMGAIT